MYYIIQENLFREYHYNTLVNYLKRYGLEYETIPFRPFTNELNFQTDRKDVFFFGSVNGARVAEQYGWVPGTLYNDSHDIEKYGPRYGDNMLNNDGYILDIMDNIPDELPEYFFARPSKDTKIFSGGMFSKESWKEWVDGVNDNGDLDLVRNQTKIFVASPKGPIQQEIRCWIVGGKIATMSQYKIGSRVTYQNMDNNEDAKYFVKDMLKLFNPARAYVLDICLYKDEYKVVEINCINASGFYDGDMSKLIQALEEEFSK